MKTTKPNFQNNKIILNSLIFLFLFILYYPSLVLALDNIIISQVLYDPINSETSGEVIELYNPTSSTIEVSNYTIKSSSSDHDATIPLNSFMPPNTYFLITDLNFNQNKDNASWPFPDYEESLSLANSNSGIALMYNNQIIDSIGWGNISNPFLYELVPALGVREGKSLRRIGLQDTNNNLLDLEEVTPFFHNSSFNLEKENNSSNFNQINLELNINNSLTKILSYGFEQDIQELNSYQIMPNPGKNKTVRLNLIIEDKDTTKDINEINAFFKNELLNNLETNILNSTTLELIFELNLPYYLPAGNYSINIISTDNSGNEYSELLSFEYLPVIAIEVDSSNLNFNELKLSLEGDEDISTPENPTIMNIGNTAIDLGFSSEDFIFNDNILPASILKYSLNERELSDISNDLTIKEVNLLPGSLSALNLKIEVPNDAVKGKYTSKVLISGVAK